ncbi:hypothetical protein NPIL_404591 [Nephila pilipes]|uniref:Uncharacterized protein n=1 Tax=Nephila pilipes TaxID=299642 RepID=A0A8X6R4H6_NEPPI|nr:hypothetical protein NPIL_404591 [Nephila pilipes]
MGKTTPLDAFVVAQKRMTGRVRKHILWPSVSTQDGENFTPSGEISGRTRPVAVLLFGMRGVLSEEERRRGVGRGLFVFLVNTPILVGLDKIAFASSPVLDSLLVFGTQVRSVFA